MDRQAVTGNRALIICAVLIFVAACASPNAQPQHTKAAGSGLSGPIPIEPQGPLVPLDVAQAQIRWKIQVPSYVPPGVALQGVLADTVAPESLRVRIHYSNGVILLEGPRTEPPPPVSGKESSTTVNGYPGFEINAPRPHNEFDPVSQVAWWTGSMFFDLYGGVDFQDVRHMADSME